ncbi:MAG: sugar ABC transporter permease [Nitrospinota bacterium]|nr:MAG: sugar ABC transporter permease [Nitrospinota bacterium]
MLLCQSSRCRWIPVPGKRGDYKGREKGMATSGVKSETLARVEVPMTFTKRFENVFGKDALAGYGFILPATIVLVALVAYPFGLSVYYSLSDKVIGRPGSFIGLDNFLYIIFDDDIFRRTLRNTLIFATVAVALKASFGLGLALLLKQATKLKRFFRGAVLVPFVAPTALTTLGWWLIFDPTYSQLNWVLKRLGLPTYYWLGDETLALCAVIFVNFWRGLPFFAVTMFAGLVAIPQELYEAAETDGASAFSRFLYITLPLLRPVMAIIILFSTIFTLADFNIVYVLTRGGPMNSTHLFATYAYTMGIMNSDLGTGAAISLFLFPILVFVVIFQLKMVRRQTDYAL